MKNYTTALLVAGILIMVNVLGSQFFLRLDLTKDKQYTLGKATKDILKELEEPITVTAYFTDDLPAQYAKIKKDFKELLVEYSNRSKGMVDYEFISPNQSTEMEQTAQQAGISPVMINVREKDQASQKRAYLGAIVQMGDQKDVIPFVQPGGAMEYALTTSIKKISVTNKPAIGIITGHGEPSIQEMAQAAQSLSILYSPEPLTLDAPVPDKYRTIAFIAPKDSINPMHFKVLDDFLGKGGNIYVAINAVDADFSSGAPSGNAKTTGLEGWLSTKGIQVENSFVVDANCGAISVQRGNFPFPMQVKFPFLPLISNFSDHPISKGLESVNLQFASPITFMGGGSNTQFTPLAFSSNKSGTVGTPAFFDVDKQWGGGDFPMSKIVVAGVLEGNLVGETASKIVVIGDGDFAVNGGGGGRQQQRLSEDNVSLMVNSIDYLSDDTGLIDLRTRAVTSRPIEQIDDGKRTFLKWLNFFLPILLVIGYGVFRMNARRAQRMRRREANYG